MLSKEVLLQMSYRRSKALEKRWMNTWLYCCPSLRLLRVKESQHVDHGVYLPHRVHLCNMHVSHFWTVPVPPCPKSETEKRKQRARPGSTQPTLIFSYDTLVPRRKPACALKIGCYCESRPSFPWKLICLLTCSLTFTSSTVTTLFWGEAERDFNWR